MNYNEIATASESLSYRDKLRLAQLLIQTARKEEENENPKNRTKEKNNSQLKEVDTIGYVVERLLKLKPTKNKSLKNSIKSMFQFQGSISEEDIDKIIAELQKQKHIKIEQNNVSYL